METIKTMKKIVKEMLRKFGVDVRRVSDEHVTPITAKWMGNFFYFVERYQYITNVPGDIVECGVGRGRTFLYLAFLVSEDLKPRTLWGFDSFKGFPEPTKEDKSFRNPQKGERNNTTVDSVTWLLKDAGIPKEVLEAKVKLVPGFFNESLKKFSGSQIAFLHLDGDLYESYRGPLEYLYPKVAKGGVVLFDEYGDPAFPGGDKAIRDYFKGKNVEILKDRLSGKHYFVKP